MHRTHRAGLTGTLLVTGLIGLIAVAGGPATAPAGESLAVAPAPFVDRSQFGTLELHTDPNGGLAVKLTITGEASEYYNLTPSKQARCKVDAGRTGPYLSQFLDLEVVGVSFAGGTLVTTAFDPARAIGLVDNGLGSRDQDNCNRSNGRLEPGHGFVIELGSDPRFDDVVFDYGVLDIEGKFGADLYAERSLNGIRGGLVEDGLGGASDNDADAGGSDNTLVHIGAVPTGGGMGAAGDDFDQLVILPVNSNTGGYYFDRGELSLEGGGDFADGSHRTVFNLVTTKTYEYQLACYDDGMSNTDGSVELIEESPDDADWSPVAGSADPIEARVFRYLGYVHTDGDYGVGEYPTAKDTCDLIGASLSADDPGVLLEPSDESAFLRVELTWVIPADELNDTNDPSLDRMIDLDGPGTLFGPEAARYCEGFGPSSATSDPASAFDPGDPGVADHVLVDPEGVSAPEFVPWCVISDVRELTQMPDGTGGFVEVVVQTQVWDGIGDPMWN